MRRYVDYFATIVFLLNLPVSSVATEVTTDSIDYAAPEKYLVIEPSLGNRAQIEEHAKKLKARNDRATVRKVLEWMDQHLKHEADKAYEWRNFDKVIGEGCYGGCADQAIACGVLLKAAGIPTVWVKTMDVPWIWDFKQGRPFESWSGHVFLEVYLDKQWLLLDPAAKMLYMNYSINSRILPGNRFAYHKGNDPKQMIMSLQWEKWKEQTRSYFQKLDSRLLPVDMAAAISVVPQVYIVGNDPAYKVMTEMVRSKGWSARNSFNTDYEKNLPLATGHTLLIETHRGAPIVPIDVLDKFFPRASDGLKAPDGVVEIAGTKLMFVDFAKTLTVLDESDSQQEK